MNGTALGRMMIAVALLCVSAGCAGPRKHASETGDGTNTDGAMSDSQPSGSSDVRNDIRSDLSAPPLDVAIAMPPVEAGGGGPEAGAQEDGRQEAGAQETGVTQVPSCDEQSCDATTKNGCCPKACNSMSDLDCSASCGNAILEEGEYCDPPSSCPTACANRACSVFALQGSVAQCNARCVAMGQLTICKDADGCCPTGCNVGNDKDCSAVCGNGVKEGSETCDPLTTCPTICPADKCLLKKLVNGGTCTAECIPAEKTQTVCQSGDSCCPMGCNNTNDTDCAPACGNNVKETGELCDPCPATCPAMGCQLRKVMNPGTCGATCVNDRLITACMSGDGCCPTGCNNTNDTDCAPACGNNVKETGELCDPCPATCPAMGCQLRKVMNPGTCGATCVNDRLITACMSGDGCCPTGCNSTNDTDCAAVCGNGVVETRETCDPASQCTTSQAACVSNKDTVRTPSGDPTRCTFVCNSAPRVCGAADGQCPTGCAAGADPDCRRPDGQACALGTECVSGQCVLSTCCTGAACPDCRTHADCTAVARPVCTAGKCSGCTSNATCAAKSGAKPFCATAGGTCVECLTSANCPLPTKSICEGQICAACNRVSSPNTSCAASTSSRLPICNPFDGVCVEGCQALQRCTVPMFTVNGVTRQTAEGTCGADSFTCTITECGLSAMCTPGFECFGSFCLSPQ